MNILTRPAAENDLIAINAIYNEGGVGTTASYDLEPLSLEDQRRWWDTIQAQGHPVIVAVNQADEIAGFAYLSDFSSKAGYRYTAEHTIYMHRDFRGQGIGKILLTRLIELAQEAGIHVMYASIDAANETSLKFHEKFGFTVAGRLDEVGFKFGTWQSVVLMTRTLGNV
ncbi:N-acetyltransferase family protein [uncultured Rothia sp.]|uniref:GNAT family N-acetyltransferase n=1 Tax=uncultured Rothia sp. TaxID=316088 RepID=UPI003216C491